MSDEPALLAAILAAPEEDTPRLVYADWLQEHGREQRAEFIRVQCFIARADPNDLNKSVNHRRTGERHCRCQFCKALDSERDLRRTRKIVCELLPPAWLTKGWAVSAGTLVVQGGALFASARGFVQSLRCTASEWLEVGDAVRARHPVSRVRLTMVPRVAFALGRRLGLADDPKKVFWHRSAVEAEAAQLGPSRHTMPVDYVQALATLRLRWPGVTFELPGYPLANELRTFPAADEDTVDALPAT